MLIGVLCEVVSAVGDAERNTILTETAKEKMLAIVDALDTNDDNAISYEEFTQLMANPEALQALKDVDVSPLGIIDFADLFFFEDVASIKLSFEDFMECVLDLRASNTATVKDVLDLWKRVKKTTNKEAVLVKNIISQLEDKVGGQLDSIQKRTDVVASQITELAHEVAKLARRYAPSP
eukprot:gnl/MRDRNA2_/MRDRNA2_160192_c0_seq1.p1 gnl/MRDRNA2_/MRDRNA2_160192_c0~~gnl/MRDRNA2_/MRDRNA2_160192_c0_seq1.p1  ORF type:complete len:179 (-),score=44.15 gnl/MRDRNA2_/MRDRNA2_160192_c0_seq1:292-828(-)